MNLVWTLFWFIVAVGLLVTVHEFGHYFGLSEDEIEAIEEEYWRGGGGDTGEDSA